MATTLREVLKAYLETGDQPTQAQFEALLDSVFMPGEDGPIINAGDGELDANVRRTRLTIINDILLRAKFKISQRLIEPDGTEFKTKVANPTSLEDFEKVLNALEEIDISVTTNLIDPASAIDGYTNNTGGTSTDSSYQKYEDIPVSEGETYTALRNPLFATIAPGALLRFTHFKDINGNTVNSTYSAWHSSFTVPVGLGIVKADVTVYKEGSNPDLPSDGTGLFLGGSAVWQDFGASQTAIRLRSNITKVFSDPKDVALKEDLENYAPSRTETTNEINEGLSAKLPALAQTSEVSSNILNPTPIPEYIGFYREPAGNYVSNTSYQVYEPFAVNEGDIITALRNPNDAATDKFRKTTFLDADQNVVAGGSSVGLNQFTIPAGVSFVQPSARIGYILGAFKSENPTWQDYSEQITAVRINVSTRKSTENDNDVLTKAEIYAKHATREETTSEIASAVGAKLPSVAETYEVSSNLIDPTTEVVGYIKNDGTVSTDSSYRHYPGIPVVGGQTYTALRNPAYPAIAPSNLLRFSCFYDSEGVVVASSYSAWHSSFVAPAGAVEADVSCYAIYDLPADGTGLFLGTDPVWQDFSNPTKAIRITASPKSKTDPKDVVINEEMEAYAPSRVETTNEINAAIAGIGGDNTSLLSIATAYKLLIGICSYSEGVGNMAGKGFINKLSEYVNINLVNYATGGHRIVDFTNDLRTDVAKYGSAKPSEIKPWIIALLNIGNETIESYNEISSEFYKEELKEAILTIKGLGALPILSTDHLTNHSGNANNAFVEALINELADSEGVISHCIGVLGEKVVSRDYAPFFLGSHPGSRTSAYQFLEWLYFLSQLKAPKALKIFRPRSAVSIANVNTLNYDSIPQRAKLWREIGVGEGALVDSTLYDQINTSPSYTAKDDEYLALLKGEDISFTNYALFEFISDVVKPSSIVITVHGDAGLTFYAKNNFAPATYAPPNKASVNANIRVTKAVYDGITAVADDIYTTPHVPVNCVYKGKYFHPDLGYILSFTVTSMTGVTYDTAGTLTLDTGSGNGTIAYLDVNLYLSRHSFEFLSTMGMAEGEFETVTAAYDNGIYTITLDAAAVAKYLLYDDLKLVAYKSSAFIVNGISAIFYTGQKKSTMPVSFKRKVDLPNVLLTGGFASDWATTWTVNNATRVQIDAAYRNYPSINSEDYHVLLGFDADGIPDSIKKSFAVTAKRGSRKLQIRLITRLFPKIFNTGLTEGTWVTHTQQIFPDSYDNDFVCIKLNVAGQMPNVFKRLVNIGWAEQYFEMEIPAFVSAFEVEIYRDFAAENPNFEMQLYDVHISHE